MVQKSHPISCLCFSKDRPFQLDGYIRSLRRFFPCALDLTVLHTATNPVIADGFRELATQHPNTRFVEEIDFGSQLLFWLKNVSSDLIFFGCDDVVFHRPIAWQLVSRTFQQYTDLLGFSLRLGRNIRFNHTRDDEVPHPAFRDDPHILLWDWRTGQADWGYPFEVNGTVYRTALVRLLFQTLENIRQQLPLADWRHPNFIENAANELLRHLQSAPTLMASFPEACLVVPTINQVQTIARNHIMGNVRTVRQLEQDRRAGKRLDIDAFHATTFNRIHIGEFFTTESSHAS
jgi:hypothetical protein